MQRERERRSSVLNRDIPRKYREIKRVEVGIGRYKGTSIFSIYSEGGLERSPSCPSYSGEYVDLSLESVGGVELLHLLGAGTFSQVFLARDVASRSLYAVKALSLRGKGAEGGGKAVVEQEIKILRKVQGHGSIIRFYGAKVRLGFVSLYFEYFNGDELFAVVKKKRHFAEAEALSVFGQLVDAVLFLHSRSVCHLDIKLENILISQGSLRIKVIDFGLAVECREGMVRGYGGTLGYSSPEAVRGGVYNGRMADSWSCGVVLFILLNGYFPFRGKSLVLRSCREGVSENTSEMVRGLLAEDLGKRRYVGDKGKEM